MLNSIGSNGVARAALVCCALALAACSNSGKPNRASLAPIPEKRPVEEVNAVIALLQSNEAETVRNSGQYTAPNAPKEGEALTSNVTKFSSKAYGVKGSPRLTTSINVRKGGGRYHVGKPYTIRGKRYVPKEDPNYKSTGLASWYGPNFHGRLTANGELYDQYALSAAHPTMPLPSYAKVTNLENGSSVMVRVNDRGPFAHNRVIDLSARAAQLLGYAKQGVAKVKVEYVGKARMDGLDEEFLVASYDPGILDPATIPANAGRPTVVANNGRKSLADHDNGTAVDVSGLQPKPSSSLISGFMEEKPDQTDIFSRFDNGLAVEAPELGMSQVSRVKIGPVSGKDALLSLSATLSDFGPVTILDDEDGNYHLIASFGAEDRLQVSKFLENSKFTSSFQ